MDLASLISHLAAHAPGFARRLQAAGLEPSTLRSPADLNALPVIRKDDLAEIQKADPPFGGFLAVPQGELKRLFQSPGPIYDPEARIPDYWRWQSALQAADFQPGDVALNAFGYHLTPAGAMFEEGLFAVGCAVIPGGVGNQEQQVSILHNLRVNAYVGLPSYLKALIEKAAELHLELFIKKAFFTAEPLPPSLRTWLNEHGVGIARQGFGTAECGNLGFECDQENGWHLPEDAIIQVCDINSGQPMPAGQTGEIVVSLDNPAYALIRFGTGDLSSLNMEPCACGRTSPRLMGWQGRIGDAVKVRGLFLHPRQLRDVMANFPTVSAWQVLITRQEHKDLLLLKAVTRASQDLENALQTALRDATKFHFEIQFVPPEALTPNSPPLQDERNWD